MPVPAVTGPALIARAQVLADMVGSDFLLPTEWTDLINDGISALWDDVTAVNKDFRVNSNKFTIASSTSPFMPNGLASLVPAFREVRAVRRDPGLSTQQYLERFPLRVGSMAGQRSYRLQDTALYIEPADLAAGNYELLYIPVPLLIGQSDFTANFMTTGALPSYTSVGVGAGAHLLTASANGVLTIDGNSVAQSQTVLVNNESNQTENGLYIENQAGSGSLPWKLLRLDPTTLLTNPALIPATLGFQVQISAGGVNTGKFMRLTTWTGDDVGPQKYTEQGLDFELAQFQEYPVQHAAMAALAKEETDISQLGTMFEATRARVQRWAAAQRSADPNIIEDVRRRSVPFGGLP